MLLLVTIYTILSRNVTSPFLSTQLGDKKAQEILICNHIILFTYFLKLVICVLRSKNIRVMTFVYLAYVRVDDDQGRKFLVPRSLLEARVLHKKQKYTYYS